MRKMNKNFTGFGLLLGVLFTFTFMTANGITGFVVFTGFETVNVDATFNESTIIPLTLPENINSIKVTGTFKGSGSAAIHLVGPNESFHIGTYQAPKVENNITVILGKGGQVIELPEDGALDYRHIFKNACEETCEGSFEGPFYLQITLEEGSFTLTSYVYEAESLFQPIETPEETNETINVTIEEPEPEVIRENPPTECSINECGEGYICHLEYCISDTGHLNITDSEGRLIALFDKYGSIMLAGDILENSEEEPVENAFRIQNKWGELAWITPEGDFHLTGTLNEEVSEIPILGTNNFIIANEEQNVCVVQGATGDLYTVNNLVTNILP